LNLAGSLCNTRCRRVIQTLAHSAAARLEGAMAFLFETRLVLSLATHAAARPERQTGYETQSTSLHWPLASSRR
jgi:homogentisate 1,2-dioxygenase